KPGRACPDYRSRSNTWVKSPGHHRRPCDNGGRRSKASVDCGVPPAPARSGGSASMTKNMLDGGQVIVDYLVREKVPYAFGLCGQGKIEVSEARYGGREDIKAISVHHETVAGFMADVYYRVSGRPTATFTSCGPGSTNLPIALANAFLDSVPFLAVTGN